MKKEFIKDSTLAFLTHILIYMKSIFLIPIIIKTVGVSVFGTFSLLISMIGIIFGLSALGVGVKSNRYLPSAKTQEEKQSLFYPPFYFQLVMILFISIIIVIFEEQILNFVSSENVIFSIYIIPIYLILYIFYVFSNNYLRYTSRISYMNYHGLAFAYGHVIIVLFYSKFIGVININFLFLSQALVSLVISFPFIKLIFKEINIKFLFFKFSELKEQIRIGFPLVLNLIVDFILAASDRFILAYFMGAIAVGLYVPAYTLGSIILLLPKAMGTVVPQMLYKCIDNNNLIQAKELFYNSIKIYLVFAVPFIFGINLIANDALILLANEEVAKTGKIISTIIALSSLFYGLNILISQANLVDLKTGKIFKANLIASLLNVILNFILLSFIENIYIPAITTLVSFIVANIYFYHSLDKKWLDKRVYSLFFKICFISILMYICVSNVDLSNFTIYYSLAIKICLSLTLYFIFIVIFRIYSKEQFFNLKVIFRR